MKDILTVLRDLKRRVTLTVARGVVRMVSDDKGLQTLQLSLLSGELRDEIEHFQNYGMTSVPLPGAEASAVFIGGLRENGMVLAVDDRRYRIQGLEAGEVCIYTDEDAEDGGHRIHMKRGGVIEINCTTANVNASEDVSVIAGANASVEAGEAVEITAGTTATVSAATTATISAPAVSINATVGGATCDITGDATVNVSGTLNLGGIGGAGIARLGDVVTIGSGSSAGTWPITSASTKVKAT